MTVVKFKRPPLRGPDWEARFGGNHAARTGRSWWALRFTDGKIVHEWDEDPGSPNGHADWPRLRKGGRQSLRLYCPNRQMVQLGDTGADLTGKLFQLKIAIRTVAFGEGVPPEMLGNHVQAHLVGMIHETDGTAICYAWEPLPEPIPDGWPNMTQAQMENPVAFERWKREHDEWLRNAGGRLVGPWDDNVYRMQYHQLGMLNADHLGIDDGEGR
jgi:hypothetical protein